MLKMRFFTGLIFCLSMFPLKAYAWGPLGHQVVCDIAWRESPKLVKKKLSSAAKRLGYKTYAQSCVWADHIRGQDKYDYLKAMHYVNVARKAVMVKATPCVKKHRGAEKPSCVLTAISYYYQRMMDDSLSQRQRDEALLLLGHFVGDLHQPLHVSYKDDLGGNRRKVIFKGKLINLHGLWDNDIVYCGLKGKVGWRPLGKRLASQASPKKSEITDIRQWANESLGYTQHIYRNLSKQASSGKLSAAYCDTYHPVALERLHLAGLRLSGLLEGLR